MHIDTKAFQEHCYLRKLYNDMHIVNIYVKLALKNIYDIQKYIVLFMFIEAEPEMLILVQELLRKCSQEKGSERSRVGQGKKIKQECSPGSDSIVVLYSTNCTRVDSTLKPFFYPYLSPLLTKQSLPLPPWRMDNSHSSCLSKDNSPEKGEALSYYQLTHIAQENGILAHDTHAHMCECIHVCMHTCVHTYTHAHCAQTHPYRQKTQGIHIKLVRWLLLETGPRLRVLSRWALVFIFAFFNNCNMLYYLCNQKMNFLKRSILLSHIEKNFIILSHQVFFDFFIFITNKIYSTNHIQILVRCLFLVFHRSRQSQDSFFLSRCCFKFLFNNVIIIHSSICEI